MTISKNGRRRGAGSRFGGAFKSFAGFMTALAAIATATATILGLMVSNQSTQLAQIRVTVSQQAQQIHRLKAATVATSSPAPPGYGSQGGQARPAGGRYLSDLTPTVDNGGYSNGQQVIVAKSYPDTVAFSCDGPNGDQPDEAYDVAGSTTFSAVVGIPDNTPDVTDVIASVTFSNEADQRIGKPVQVSLGHPVRVTLDTAGVTQLGVTCTGRNAGTGQSASGFQVALGNAHVS